MQMDLRLKWTPSRNSIQPEEEFFCEDCSTENDDEYEDEVTSRASASSTSTTTTTTTSTTTTTTTTPRPPPPTPKVVQHYPTSSPETIAALLALHNAFSQSVQNSKVCGLYRLEPTPKASVSIITSTSTSTSVRASRPNVTAPGDSPSGPEDDFPTGYDDYPDDSVDEAFFRDVPKLRTKKAAAGLVDNELSSPGSLDLKLRSRRSPGSFRKPGSRRWHGIYGQGRPRTERAMLSNEPRHTNHRYPDEAETTTTRHSNHRYEETTLKPPQLDILPEEEHPSQREEFLQNLLGSLDLEEHDRQKMANLFKVEEKEMDRSDGTLHQLGNKLGDLIMEDVNKTINQAKMEETNTTNEHLDLNKIDELFRHHYEEMSQETKTMQKSRQGLEGRLRDWIRKSSTPTTSPGNGADRDRIKIRVWHQRGHPRPAVQKLLFQPEMLSQFLKKLTKVRHHGGF
ncbi:unnamed protein product [Nesidiocoris tenuis]|uniref:Uncharacterized protein n=1 Tax=Nesidiocoris tenuis TaxID=355587 RepID=A0A6H5G965_9HEMI|nr:unnamed protein product [Nesidiocoris tenuis]